MNSLKKKTANGTLHHDALFIRQLVGEATDNDSGIVYELSTTMAGAPIIFNPKTKLSFVMSWKDLLLLAIENGIDDLKGFKQ